MSDETLVSDTPPDVGDVEAPPTIAEAAKRLHTAREEKRRAEQALDEAKRRVAEAEQAVRLALQRAGLTRATVSLGDGRQATVYLTERRFASLDRPDHATDEERAMVLARAIEALERLGLDEFVRTQIEYQGLAALIRAIEDANTGRLQEFGDLPPALLQHVGEPAEEWLPEVFPGIKFVRVPGAGLRVTTEE